MLTAAVWTTVAVCALLLAEKRGSRIGVWLAKPAASLGFVAPAWFAGQTDDSYAPLMLVALILCAVGDVLLIPLGQGASFLAGLVSFALGHALYAAAFWSRWPLLDVTAVTAAGMAIVAWFTLRWLDPYLERALYWAVRVYILLITAMVVLAVGASAATGDARIAIGAIAFAASDLSVARERFVRPGFVNLLWGLPLYYAAQLLLVWSVVDRFTRA